MGDSILKRTFSDETFSKWLPERFVNNTIIWLHIQYGRILLFLNKLQIFYEQLYFTLFKIDRRCLSPNWTCDFYQLVITWAQTTFQIL